MANEHIKTAANNLQRAVSDVNQQIQEAKNDIDNSKRQTLSSIKALKTEIATLNSMKNKDSVTTSGKVALNAQTNNLQRQIAQLQKDNDEYVRQREGQISALNNEVHEFENLSSHLNAIA